MASRTGPIMSSALPEVPVKHNDFLSYVTAHPDTPMTELIEPYKKCDSKIRELFAQEPDHPALNDPFMNVTPVFSGQESNATIRARNLDAESDIEKEHYLMPLDDKQRKPSGSPAVVQSLKEFQTNFNIFSESSLSDLDWSNVVAVSVLAWKLAGTAPDKGRPEVPSSRRFCQFRKSTRAPSERSVSTTTKSSPLRLMSTSSSMD